MQLQEVVPSAYCRVSYSMFGLESDEKVHTRLMFLFMSAVGVGGFLFQVVSFVLMVDDSRLRGCLFSFFALLAAMT